MARDYDWLHWKGGREIVPGSVQKYARVLLGELKESIARAGIQSGSRTVNLPDGSSLTVAVAAGTPSVRFVPAPVSGKKRKKVRFLERAYLSFAGDSGETTVIAVDLAEYVVENGAIRQTREIYALAALPTLDIGAGIRAIATGRPNLLADPPAFPKFYYVHTGVPGGEPGQMIHKVDIATNTIVLSLPAASESEVYPVCSFNIPRNQLCFSYIGDQILTFFDAETLEVLGSLSSPDIAPLTSEPAWPHPSGDFYILPSKLSFASATYLYAVTADDFTPTFIFDLSSALPGVTDYVSTDLTMSGNTLFVSSAGFDDVVYSMKMAAVSFDYTEYPPTAAVSQPAINMFTLPAGPGLIDVSRFGKQVAFEVFFPTGSTRFIQGTPAVPLTRIEFPRVPVGLNSNPRHSTDGKRLYYATYGGSTTENRLFAPPVENLAEVTPFAQLPDGFSSNDLNRLELALIELPDPE